MYTVELDAVKNEYLFKFACILNRKRKQMLITHKISYERASSKKL